MYNSSKKKNVFLGEKVEEWMPALQGHKTQGL